METTTTLTGSFRQRAAQAVRAVAGVARVAESDIRMRHARDGRAYIDCTLTACPDVQLDKLGTAVQAALAKTLQQAGMEAREINIYISDIDDRAPASRPSDQPPGVGFDHG